MLDATEELRRYAARRLAAWEQNDITLTETAGWFLDYFAVALLENSDASAILSSVITSVPQAVVAGINESLERCKTSSGTDRWLPGGQPLTYPVGPGPWMEADQHKLPLLIDSPSCWVAMGVGRTRLDSVRANKMLRFPGHTNDGASAVVANSLPCQSGV